MSITVRRGFNAIHGHDEGEACTAWCHYEPKWRVRVWRALAAKLARTESSDAEDWPVAVTEASEDI